MAEGSISIHSGRMSFAVYSCWLWFSCKVACSGNVPKKARSWMSTKSHTSCRSRFIMTTADLSARMHSANLLTLDTINRNLPLICIDQDEEVIAPVMALDFPYG